MNRPTAYPIAFLRAIPHSYSTILFSDNLWMGAALLVFTLVSPYVGLSGLLGLMIALLASRLAGFEDWGSDSGVLAFNSLLVSLALGYYYPISGIHEHPLEYLTVLTVSSLAALGLYVVLNHFTQTRLRLPSMSLSFSLMATLIWYYLVRSGNFTGVGFAKPLLISWNPELLLFWKHYLLSMGSIMFVPDILIGIGVTLILIGISRIAFLLSLLGWGVCWWLLGFASIGDTYGMFFPGFNLILISLSIGSVFLIPSKSSYLIAALATVVGFGVAFALSGKYYYPDYMPARGSVLFVPMFAFPLNFVVMTTIFALRQRLNPRSPVLNEIGILHPEQALEAYLSRYKRFSSTGIPQLQLPLVGQWTVTQGVNGAHTHQKEWANAWDFEIGDKDGKHYSNDPADLKDYYSFGKPVHAAAAGYVAKVVNGIADNPVGIPNTHDNWGNYISLYHSPGFYTLYAHLKEGSIKLAEGDYVKQGDKLALVGNSGRSPYPHLHFQAQAGPEPGSKSISCHLLNYKVQGSGESVKFIGSDIPREGEIISPLIPEKELANLLQLGYRQQHVYRVRDKGKDTTETWEIDLDLYGIHRIKSSRGTVLEFSIYNGIFNALKLTKRKPSALRAFALSASRIPWSDNSDMRWEDEPSLSVILNGFGKNLALFLIPFFKPIRVRTCARLYPSDSLLIQESETILRVLGYPWKKYNTRLTMSRKNGIVSVEMAQGGKTLISAINISSGEENNV